MFEDGLDTSAKEVLNIFITYHKSSQFYYFFFKPAFCKEFFKLLAFWVLWKYQLAFLKLNSELLPRNIAVRTFSNLYRKINNILSKKCIQSFILCTKGIEFEEEEKVHIAWIGTFTLA